jgi:hypothetical protein
MKRGLMPINGGSGGVHVRFETRSESQYGLRNGSIECKNWCEGRMNQQEIEWYEAASAR